MTRRTKLWLGLAALFIVGNLVFAAIVGVAGEGTHAMAHLAVVLPAAYVMKRLLARAPEAATSPMIATDERLDQLQQSLDAVAIEVERIGESQRFSARLAAERVPMPR